MRKTFAQFLVVAVLSASGAIAQTKTPPAKIVLPAKTGNVTYDHAAHLKREKNDCKGCHPGLFAQDAKAPVAFKPPHKNAEDKKASCGACHRAGGTAFETKGNCLNSKCHVKAAAKKA